MAGEPGPAAVEVVKFTADEGPEVGDHDTIEDAFFGAAGETRIGFRITNTGEVDLTDVRLTDQTIAGAGTVAGITCTQSLDRLPVGGSIDCEGTLPDLEGLGGFHGDRATVTATPAAGGDPVTASDDWFAGKPPRGLDYPQDDPTPSAAPSSPAPAVPEPSRQPSGPVKPADPKPAPATGEPSLGRGPAQSKDLDRGSLKVDSGVASGDAAGGFAAVCGGSLVAAAGALAVRRARRRG